jgi:Zn-dependent protease
VETIDIIVKLICELVAILLVIDVFEFSKALASTLQGDVNPKNNGELTLNPFKHFEPIGYILLLFTHVGWGQPVKISHINYKSKRTGTLITYLTPMVLSLLLAFGLKFAIVFLAKAFSGLPEALGYVITLLAYLRKYFIYIAIVNLIPIEPFCGNRLIRCFLSPNAQMSLSQNQKLLQVGFIILLLCGFVGQLAELIASYISVVI